MFTFYSMYVVLSPRKSKKNIIYKPMNCMYHGNNAKRKLLNFENWSSSELSKIKHHFRKQSYLKIYMIKKCLWQEMCSYIHILRGIKNSVRFWWFLTLKIDFESQILAIFDTSPLHQFEKFNNFLWVCWFSAKIVFNFVSPPWKLHNRYYHSIHID